MSALEEKEEIGCLANRDKRNGPEKPLVQGGNFPSAEVVFSGSYSEILGWA